MTLSLLLAILGPLLPILGLFIGALLTRNHDLGKFRKDRITAAYTAYLDAVARASSPRMTIAMQKMLLLGLAQAGKAPAPTPDQMLTEAEWTLMDETQARFVNAHSNLVIYAPQAVIGALSHFYDSGGDP